MVSSGRVCLNRSLWSHRSDRIIVIREPVGAKKAKEKCMVVGLICINCFCTGIYHLLEPKIKTLKTIVYVCIVHVHNRYENIFVVFVVAVVSVVRDETDETHGTDPCWEEWDVLKMHNREHKR